MIRWPKNQTEQDQPVKRGRGRPPKNPEAYKEAHAGAGIAQRQLIRLPKIALPLGRKWLYGAVGLIIALVPTIYFYSQNKNTQRKLAEAQKTSQTSEATQAIIKDVGKLVVLPEGEEPSVATVSDLSKLQGQPFFAKAANGDKVLVYNKAQRAILYRPSINKIVEMAPLNTTDQSSL